MELEFQIQSKNECEFIYSFTTKKIKFLGLDENVVMFLTEYLQIHPESTDDFIKFFSNQLLDAKKKINIRFENEIFIPSVGTRYYIVRARYYRRTNCVKGLLIDDTKNQIINKKTVQAEKLRSLGALAGGIAHNFNNQLMVILGSCQLLKKSIDDPKLEQLLENIEFSAKNSAELIKKLLRFSSSEKVIKEKINLVELVDDVVAILKSTSDRRTSIVYDCEETQIEIEANRGLIQNALLNVCQNALESFDNDGMIAIKTSVETLRRLPENVINRFEFEPGIYAIIKITDNGKGIEKNKIHQIFDPFYTSKGFDQATGLGLSTVLGTVESHDGFVGLKSTIEKGTTFSFYLKLTKGEESMRLNKDKKEIMVIDDEYLVRMIVKEMLIELGYEVICFENGESAVEYYTEHSTHVSLVICDMMMPKMTGKEVYYKLKELNNDIKFMILSGYSNEDNKELAKVVDAYLKKPLMLDTLSVAIEKALK